MSEHQGKTAVIYTDGGSRYNPGPAGIGGVVLVDGNQIHEFAEYIGRATNNEAEYKAFLHSLVWVGEHGEKMGFEKIEWWMDSQLVVEQLNKNWRVKDQRLAKFAQEIWQRLEQLPFPFSISHVRRENNKEADRLVNQAVDDAFQRGIAV
jgi:ribonuclease HI